MNITAAMVKELRESTGAGMMDCKNALKEVEGDFEKAVQYLREKGLGKAAKKADRVAAEGLVAVKVAGDKASIIELNSETDFVAKNDNFLKLCADSLTHIQENDIKNSEALMASQINGSSFEEYLKGQIATIGENLVVRRFETLEANESDLVVNGYLHSNGRMGTIILAKTKADKEKVLPFLKQLCMHITAMKPVHLSSDCLDIAFIEAEYKALVAELEKDNEERKRLGKPLHKIPLYASKKQLTQDVIENFKEDLKAELKAQNKPEKIWDNIIAGKVNSFIADNSQLDAKLTLLGQFFILDDKKTIEQVLEAKASELGGELEIVKFVRFEVGEGIEKKQDDFAAEVAAQIG